MSSTRQRILETARTLFNAEGVHRVGVRDVARALGMSPGNLAYHFPTKDDLVRALVLELHERNQRTVFDTLPSSFSLVSLYQAAQTVMRSILVYRFVLLSYVDAVKASPELRALDAKLTVARRVRHEGMLALLVKGGWLRRAVARAPFLFEQGEMISSGWLAAAALHPTLRDDEEIVRHYAKVGIAVLDPYTTPKGKRQLRAILAGEHDDAS